MKQASALPLSRQQQQEEPPCRGRAGLFALVKYQTGFYRAAFERPNWLSGCRRRRRLLCDSSGAVTEQRSYPPLPTVRNNQAAQNPKIQEAVKALVSLNTDSSIRQTHSLSCLTNDAHKAFLSHSPPSCTALLCLLHPYFCKQTRPRFCTLHRKKKSIAVEQKPMGSARNMLLAPSASCYYGNNEGFL